MIEEILPTGFEPVTYGLEIRFKPYIQAKYLANIQLIHPKSSYSLHQIHLFRTPRDTTIGIPPYLSLLKSITHFASNLFKIAAAPICFDLAVLDHFPSLTYLPRFSIVVPA